ncbi:MAG: chap protein, partial [Actinomycetota bacterium]|nr:chap protein [Actinomycetota bacterium]
MSRTSRVATLAVLVGIICSATALAAARAPRLKLVRYLGVSVRVPASWPVFDLARDPLRCVRFDRHAVYLGPASRRQRCPAHAVGRTEAL